MRWFRHALLSAALISAAAFAHAALLDPAPRSSDSAIKTGPCGPYAKLNTPTPVLAGQALPVSWEETVDHPGHYRLAFSMGADNDFNQNILADNIPNPSGLQATNSTTVQLPNINCDNCTLQLIQVMTDRTPPNDKYYSCADIRLYGSDAGVTDAGSGGGAGGGGGTGASDAGQDDAGSPASGGGGGGGGAVTQPKGTAQAEGGCSAAGFAPAILAPILIAFALRRRARHSS